MIDVNLADFKSLVRQGKVFAYNQQLVAASLGISDPFFQAADVLDAGAGRRIKHFGSQLRQAERLVGIDVAYDDLRVNRDIGEPVVGDLERLPFQRESFDCVISVDVVEHLSDPASFFQEAARCLRPNGVLILCTPNLLGYKNLIARALPRPVLDSAWRYFKGRPEQPHRTYYRCNTVGQVRRLGQSAGLLIDHSHHLNEISHFCYPYPALSWLSYLYGRLLSVLRLGFLLNYIVCVLRKPALAFDQAESAETTAPFA